MAETVFAGSSILSRGSRILLVSLLQLPESKILIQEPAVSVRLFPRPTSPSVSFWQPQFSLLPTFLPLSLFFLLLSVNRASLVSLFIISPLFSNFSPHFLTQFVCSKKLGKSQILSLYRPVLQGCSWAQIKPHQSLSYT